MNFKIRFTMLQAFTLTMAIAISGLAFMLVISAKPEADLKVISESETVAISANGLDGVAVDQMQETQDQDVQVQDGQVQDEQTEAILTNYDSEDPMAAEAVAKAEAEAATQAQTEADAAAQAQAEAEAAAQAQAEADAAAQAEWEAQQAAAAAQAEWEAQQAAEAAAQAEWEAQQAAYQYAADNVSSTYAEAMQAQENASTECGWINPDGVYAAASWASDAASRCWSWATQVSDDNYDWACALASEADSAAANSWSLYDTCLALAEEAAYLNSVDGLRQQLVDFAAQYVGVLPYVWGSHSLEYGADCSGFTSAVYAHFGYSISAGSEVQSHQGRSVSLDDIKLGDIVVYSGHVAIYAGNGQIIHSPSPGYYVSYASMYCLPIQDVRRIIE